MRCFSLSPRRVNRVLDAYSVRPPNKRSTASASVSRVESILVVLGLLFSAIPPKVAPVPAVPNAAAVKSAGLDSPDLRAPDACD